MAMGKYDGHSAFTWEAREEVSSMYVTEFTLHVKPGHFEQVARIHSEFAADFLGDHPALQTVMVVGDEASGVVRGIGVYMDREAADEVNSDPEFAAYNDRIEPLLASPPERVELELLHHYSR
jgi:quinol monooxygenase YgiN